MPRPDDPTVVDASLIPAPDPTPVAAEPAASKLCLQCGGEVDADGYCTQCGAKAPTEREHFEESPAAWVGAVCDRGVKHARNEDALATAADEAMGSRAVLVAVSYTHLDVYKRQTINSPAERLAALRSAPEQTTEILLEQARIVLSAGDRVASKRLTQAILAQNPWDWRAIWMDGVAALMAGDLSLIHI